MKFLFNLLLGVTFGLGLILSKIFDPATVIEFLNWNENWNPSFLYTVLGMIIVGPIFFLLGKIFNLTYKSSSKKNRHTSLDAKVIIGSILFGIGWSVSGLSISTAIINLAFGEWQSTLFFIFMIFGFYCPKFLKKITL